VGVDEQGGKVKSFGPGENHFENLISAVRSGNAMDLVVFENNKPLILFSQQVVDKLAAHYPSPRQRQRHRHRQVKCFCDLTLDAPACSAGRYPLH
jgi:hypothetical protein